MPTSVNLYNTVSDGKSCFSVKKLISTSEQRAEHPFAGRNTQHINTNFIQAWIAQLKAHQLGTGEVQGLNPGKVDNFSMKIKRHITVK